MARHARGFDTAAVRDHLARCDRKLGAWMRRIGVIQAETRWRGTFDPVDALARAILLQQLSGKADVPTNHSQDWTLPAGGLRAGAGRLAVS